MEDGTSESQNKNSEQDLKHETTDKNKHQVNNPSNSVSKKEQSSTSNILPETANHYYHYIIFGALIFSVGSVLIRLNLFRSNNNNR
ncbi:hypothetical protein LC087_02055 [Bacillus carboniphilus]|uniref:Gram-positive cocci surface proteins LPxTG domain-containing protein n=1 Tax=Bacillus carboniphilus TaxID=86663 RepID=A0ABY9JUD4_9BACI|nr:hypothetical protein [Bacillus carboniphilus]WLR43026.1 hypothetical protein LC087_02055 [Bacillus carboniphilus]